MSDASTLFHKISSDEIMKHIGEDVRVVFLVDEMLGFAITSRTCTCKVMLGCNGDVVLSDGDNIEDINMSLEEFLLRAHIAGEKCIWKIDTTHADVMRYGDELFTRMSSHASFFCDFQLPSGFNLLEKGIDVYEA